MAWLDAVASTPHIANIFSKLELLPASDDHRRVLAVLALLRGPG
jgi:hypothetical protein